MVDEVASEVRPLSSMTRMPSPYFRAIARKFAFGVKAVERADGRTGGGEKSGYHLACG
jgi:hypothetical protein